MAPEFARWLTARHLSSAIDTFSVTQTEAYLADNGYLAPTDREPPAISFVDLSDFTRVTQERGDDAAARLALAFADLALRIAPRHGGRVVKLLGDGVLLKIRLGDRRGRSDVDPPRGGRDQRARERARRRRGWSDRRA